MRKLLTIALLVGGLGGVTLSSQPLSNQVLQLLTRINTWTAKNTFLDLRLQAGVPSDTTLRFYVDNSGNLFFNGGLVAGAGGGVTPHNVLSTTHSDSLAGTVVRGDVIVGNATPKWARLAIGAAGTILRSDGTDAAWSTVASALTAIPGGNITGALAAVSGAALTALNASNLASGTVPLARLSGITTTEISASAAIPYSKLALTGGLVNADVNASAAIAYSKLNLGTSIVSTDLAAGSLPFTKWPSNACTNGQVPQYDGANWGCATVGTGSGTVTSVALTAPPILTVTGSPVTTTGTLALTLATQTANQVWAGPAAAGPATPTFRSLVTADFPVTGVAAGTYGRVTVDTSGRVTAATVPAVLTSDVSGILPMANGGTGVGVSADDSVLVGSGAAWVAQTLPNCPTGALGYTTATNSFSCTSSGGPTHNLLSATHPDTLAGTPVRGDLVVANSTPVWAKKAIGTVGTLLQSDGVDPGWTNTIARGTVTTSQPWTFTQTWNAGGVDFGGLILNITNTASGAGSRLLNLQVAGTPKYSINVSGVPSVVSGLTTAGNGQPILLATTGLLSGQVANIAVTNLLASAPVGFYRVCAFEAVTTVGTTSTMPRVTISFNNGVAQTFTLIASNTGNLTTTFGQDCMVFHAAAASAIAYDAGTTGGPYASTGTPMQYHLRVTLEALY